MSVSLSVPTLTHSLLGERLGASVEEDVVGAAGAGAGDAAGGGEGSDAGGDVSGGSAESLKVQDKASNVRGGHGGSRDGVGGSVGADPGGEDRGAGGEDVEDGAVVGEGRAGPVGGDGADGDGRGSRGGRGVGGIDVAVAGGDDRDDVAGEGRVDGVVEGRREATTEGQVDDSVVLAAGADDVVHSPVIAVDDDGGGGGRALEDLDGDDGGALGNTVGRASNGASNVSAVAVGVGGATADGVVAERGPTAELVVGGKDASVDDVGVAAGAGRVVIPVGGRARGAAGGGAQTPGGAGLGNDGLSADLVVGLGDLVEEVPDLVLLNIGDL